MTRCAAIPVCRLPGLAARLIALLALIGPAAAKAQTANTSFGVEATIEPGCLVTQGGSDGSRWGQIDFGEHLGLKDQQVSAALSQVANLELHCTAGLTLQMRIGPGTHYRADASVRAMQRTGGNALVSYRLYRDAAQTQPIRVDTPVALTAPEDTGALVLPVYARAEITAGTPAGLYQDQLTVELTW